MTKVREMARSKVFGRPGHGAPTVDVRKKKFTEHQLDKEVKRGGQDWDGEEAPPPRRHERAEDCYDSHVRMVPRMMDHDL
jgi:hypothetical protein